MILYDTFSAAMQPLQESQYTYNVRIVVHTTYVPWYYYIIGYAGVPEPSH